MMKKILIFLVLLSCSISPVAAETIQLTHTDISEHLIETTDATTYVGYFNGLTFEDITKYAGLECVVLGTEKTPYGTNPGWVSKSTPATFKIGASTVGYGTLTVTNVFNSGSVCKVIGCIEFEDWDVLGYSGMQQMIMDLDDDSLEDSYWATTCKPWQDVAPSSWESIYGYSRETGFGILPTHSDGYMSYRSYVIKAYNHVEFAQSLVYEDYDSHIDLTINRNGFGNQISVVGQSGLLLYSDATAEDYTGNFYDLPVWVNVTNPYTLEIWSNLIPEESEVPSDQTALVHSYVYDAVTGNLINGMTITTAYDGGGGGPCSWPGGVAHTTLDWSYADAANLTASADGYETSAVHRYVGSSVDTSGVYLPAGDEITDSFYLMPTGTPSNTTAWAQFSVTEQLSGEVYFHSSGASVTIGNTSLITDAMGTCSFELSSGTYDYIVKKTGFQTVSGSFSLGSSNQAISVALPKIPTAPTPTGQPGIDYPYADVDPRAQAEESAGIIFDALPAWAGLCVIVVTVSFLGWMSPKKGRR